MNSVMTVLELATISGVLLVMCGFALVLAANFFDNQDAADNTESVGAWCIFFGLIIAAACASLDLFAL